MIIGIPTIAGQFSYYIDGSRSNPVSYMFSKDITQDGVDEVFFVSFETQPNTPSNYSNTSVHIFGWKNNQFQEITSEWLPNSSHLVEGVGDVAFGDFNGDGLVDVFLSAYTDMDHPVNAYVLMNQGNRFEKVSLGLETWMHAVAAADINQDGFDDVLVAGYSNFHQYLGSPSGLIRYQGMVGSSGLALGDFLGDGSTSAIYVDAGSNITDTFLYQFVFDHASKTIGSNKIATLPGPRLAALGLETETSSSHDIRARAMDFNGDGLLDVVVFSYLANYTGGLQSNDHKSEIQFLLNHGDGHFTDVTDLYRVNYDVKGYVGYYPQITDINHDGLLDIFSSVPDWMPNYNSTTLLLQKQDGTFVDTDRVLFSTNIVSNHLGQSIVVTGPEGNTYLVSEGKWDWSNPISTVYIQSMSFPKREQSEFLIGTANRDVIFGLGGDDQIFAKQDDDILDGGAGIDTSIYQGLYAQYTIIRGEISSNVADSLANRDGIDTLTNVERLQFSDTNLALDVGPTQHAGSVYMLYKAAFNRAPDLGGMGYWLAQKDSGKDIVTSIAQGFVDSAEFISKYGLNPTNLSYINNLYQNVLGRAGETGGVTYWTSEMDAGRVSKALALVQFATLPEGAALVANLIANGIPYQEWIV